MKTKIYLSFFILIISVLYFTHSPEIAAAGDAFSVFSASCARCHVLRNPKKYEKAVWTFHVKRMSKRAKITASQKQTIISVWDIDGISEKVAKWNKKNK
ncbi:MAG TPA: hypothetical protein ENI73_08575 [Spirochaetes bacterium]|nr:hypothetical protein [Spirochaetota bacterium]